MMNSQLSHTDGTWILGHWWCLHLRNRENDNIYSLLLLFQTIQQLEQEMLNGQSLQGPPTAAEIYEALSKQGMEDR
jgi:glycerol-3-phosphate dehydrogenase (NAD+)